MDPKEEVQVPKAEKQELKQDTNYKVDSGINSL